jgi:hypothetical protein
MTRPLFPLTLLLAAALAGCQLQAPAASPAPAEPAAEPAAAPASGPAAAPASAPAAAPAGAPAAAPSARPAVTQAPAPRPQPVVIPDGTTLRLLLDNSLSTASNHTGDAVLAHLGEDLSVGGKVVAPAGSEVRGHITAAVRSGKTKGLARMAFTFDTLTVKGTKHDVATTAVDITADPSKKKDAAIIGGGAGAGAILGAIIGGKKGAAVGAGVGAAAGTGTVLATRGKEVELGAGQPIHVNLTADARID